MIKRKTLIISMGLACVMGAIGILVGRLAYQVRQGVKATEQFVAMPPQYHEQFALACDTLLAAYPRSEVRPVAGSPAPGPALSAIIEQTKPRRIMIQPGRVEVSIQGVARLGCNVIWRENPEKKGEWILTVWGADSRHVVYTRPAHPQ